MAAPVATIDVRARLDTRGLERNVKSSLNRIEKKAKFNPISSSDSGASKMALGSMTQGADQFGKSMAAANARVFAFGASAGAIYAVGSAMKELVSSTIDVEKRLAQINVLLKGTTSELSDFRSKLFAIAKDTGQAFGTVADSANELARQGLTTEQVMIRVRDAMVLVRLSGLDSKAAVEALTAAMNTFTAAGLTSTQVVNKLANLDANFAVSTGDLAEALKRSASAAATAGVSFEELGALITVIKQKTALNAPVIGNAIKSIFVKIQRPKAMEQLDAMGIKVKEQNGQWLNSLQILKNTAKAYDGLGQSQQQQVKIMAGGLYQVNQLMAAISDLSKEYSLFDQAQEIALRNNNSALQRNAQLNLTISALVNKVTESFKEFGAVIGKDLVGPALKNILNIGGKISEALTPKEGAEGLGANIGKGLIKGLGAAISGPGLGIAVVAIAKTLGSAIKFSGIALRQIIGINDATTQQRTLQKQINEMLAQNPQLIQLSLSRTSSMAMVQKDILASIRAQGVAMQQNSLLGMNVAAMGMRGGMIQNSKTGGFQMGGGRGRASGHIPETNAQNRTAERVNAYAGGYSPGEVKSFSMAGVGKVTYNDAEKVDFLGGFKQPFISPPKDSKAGKKHRIKSIAKTGIDPYSSSRPDRIGRAMGQQMGAEGFVPNFNPLSFLHYGKIGKIKNWQNNFYTHSDFGGLHVAGQRGMREGIFKQLEGEGGGRSLYEITTNLQKNQIARSPDFGGRGIDDLAEWAVNRGLMRTPGGFNKQGYANNPKAKLAFEERLGLDELGMSTNWAPNRQAFFKELEAQRGIRAFNYRNVYEGLSHKAYQTSKHLKYSDILPSLHITDPRAITGIKEVPLSRLGGRPRETPEKNQIRAQQEIEGQSQGILGVPALRDPRLIKLHEKGLLTYSGGFVPNFNMMGAFQRGQATRIAAPPKPFWSTQTNAKPPTKFAAQRRRSDWASSSDVDRASGGRELRLGELDIGYMSGVGGMKGLATQIKDRKAYAERISKMSKAERRDIFVRTGTAVPNIQPYHTLNAPTIVGPQVIRSLITPRGASVLKRLGIKKLTGDFDIGQSAKEPYSDFRRAIVDRIKNEPGHGSFLQKTKSYYKWLGMKKRKGHSRGVRMFEKTLGKGHIPNFGLLPPRRFDRLVGGDPRPPLPSPMDPPLPPLPGRQKPSYLRTHSEASPSNFLSAGRSDTSTLTIDWLSKVGGMKGLINKIRNRQNAAEYGNGPGAYTTLHAPNIVGPKVIKSLMTPRGVAILKGLGIKNLTGNFNAKMPYIRKALVQRIKDEPGQGSFLKKSKSYYKWLGLKKPESSTPLNPKWLSKTGGHLGSGYSGGREFNKTLAGGHVPNFSLNMGALAQRATKFPGTIHRSSWQSGISDHGGQLNIGYMSGVGGLKGLINQIKQRSARVDQISKMTNSERRAEFARTGENLGQIEKFHTLHAPTIVGPPVIKTLMTPRGAKILKKLGIKKLTGDFDVGRKDKSQEIRRAVIDRIKNEPGQGSFREKARSYYKWMGLSRKGQGDGHGFTGNGNPWPGERFFNKTLGKGHIPNFGMTEVYRGIEGRRALARQRLPEALGGGAGTVQDALSGRMGIWQGRIPNIGMPSTPDQLKKALSKHIGNSSDGNMSVTGFNNSGLDPFMSASTNKHVASTFAMRHGSDKGYGYMAKTRLSGKDIFGQKEIEALYKKEGSLNSLYNMAQGRPLGFDPQKFGISGPTGSGARYGFDHEREISLLMPSMFKQGAGTGSAKTSLMKLGYKDWPSNEIKGFGKPGSFKTHSEQEKAYPIPKDDYFSSGFVPNFNLQKLANLGGSTGAELMLDPSGEKLVRKFGASNGHIINEFEANKIYRSLGVPVPDHSLNKTPQGRSFMLSKYLEGGTSLGTYMRSALPGEKDNIMKQIQSRAAKIALMADWDAIGMSQDNMMVDKKGKVVQIDSGGALRYRAQGGLKGDMFGSQVRELASLRDPSRSSSEWFGDVKDSELRKQIKGIDPSKITGSTGTKNILLQRLAMMRRFSGGFVPNFNNPLERAVSAERMGIKESGSAAKPMIGYDNRVGVGVYSSNQGSLGNAISQHLNAGQSPSTLRRTGAAEGGVPNFFMGGDSGMTGATALSFAAMGFMGMGQGTNKAEQIQGHQEDAEKNRRAVAESKSDMKVQQKILKGIEAEASKTNKQLSTLTNEQKSLTKTLTSPTGTSSSTYRMAQTQGVNLGFSTDAKVRGATTAFLEKSVEGKPISEGGTLTDKERKQQQGTSKVEQDERRKELNARRNASANFEQQTQQNRINLQEQQKINAQNEKNQRTVIRTAAINQSNANQSRIKSLQAADDAKKGTLRDPKTNNPYKNQRAMKLAAGMGRMGLGITMAAPIVAGMVGQGMFPGDNESARRGRAGVGALGSMGSMAGMGAMIGSTGGAPGAAAGAVIGGTIGLAMGVNSIVNEYTNATGELLKVFEESKNTLNKFNSGTQQVTRTYAGYVRGLNDATDSIGAVEMGRRRKQFSLSLAAIPDSERANVMQGFSGDMQTLTDNIARVGSRLRDRAEGLGGAVEFQKFKESNSSGGIMAYLEHTVKGTMLGLGGETGNEAERLIGEGMNHTEALRKSAGDVFSKLDSPEGKVMFDKFANSLIQSSNIKDMEAKDIIKMFEGSDRANNSMDLRTQMKEVGVSPEQQNEMLGMRTKDFMKIQKAFANFGHELKSANDWADLFKSISKKNRDFAANAKIAAQDLAAVSERVEFSMRNAVKNFGKFLGGTQSLGLNDLGNKASMNLETMALGQRTLSPFLTKEANLDNANQLTMRKIGSAGQMNLRKQENKTTLGTFDAIVAGIAKAGTRQTSYIQGLGGGATDQEVSTQKLLQQKTSAEQRELNRIFELAQAGQKGGVVGSDLLSSVTATVRDSTVLSGGDAGRALQVQVLETLKGLRIDSDVNLALVAQKIDHSITLQSLRNEYAIKSLEIQRNLERQGGVAEFKSGPFSALSRMDDLREGRRNTNKMGVGRSIGSGMQDFKEADFLKNYMGVASKDLPKGLIESSISSRAEQMARAAREMDASGLGHGSITDEMMTKKGNMVAAEQQVQSVLKGGIPQSLQDIKAKIQSANEALITDNAENEVRFKRALESVFDPNYGLDVKNKLDALVEIRNQEVKETEKDRSGQKKLSAESLLRTEVMNAYQMINQGKRLDSDFVGSKEQELYPMLTGQQMRDRTTQMLSSDFDVQGGMDFLVTTLKEMEFQIRKIENSKAADKVAREATDKNGLIYPDYKDQTTDKQLVLLTQLKQHREMLKDVVLEQKKIYDDETASVKKLNAELAILRANIEKLSRKKGSGGRVGGIDKATGLPFGVGDIDPDTGLPYGANGGSGSASGSGGGYGSVGAQGNVGRRGASGRSGVPYVGAETSVREGYGMPPASDLRPSYAPAQQFTTPPVSMGAKFYQWFADISKQRADEKKKGGQATTHHDRNLSRQEEHDAAGTKSPWSSGYQSYLKADKDTRGPWSGPRAWEESQKRDARISNSLGNAPVRGGQYTEGTQYTDARSASGQSGGARDSGFNRTHPGGRGSDFYTNREHPGGRGSDYYTTMIRGKIESFIKQIKNFGGGGRGGSAAATTNAYSTNRDFAGRPVSPVGTTSSIRDMLRGAGMAEGHINDQRLAGIGETYNQAMYKPVDYGSDTSRQAEESAKWTEQHTRVNEKLKIAILAADKASVSFEQRVLAIATAMKEADVEGRFRRGEISGRDLAASKKIMYDQQAQSGTFDIGSTGDLFKSQFAYNDMDQLRDYQRLITETATTMKDSFKGAFHDFATGAKSSKDAFGDMATSILTKITSITHDMAWDSFFGALMGPDYSNPQKTQGKGYKRKGFSNGGTVHGRKGIDKVPAMLTEGEFVVNARDAERNSHILRAINSGQRLAKGGSINSVARNQFDFFRDTNVDDELSARQPTSGVMNVSESLSQIGQEDRGINPQNRIKFDRQEALFSYNKENYEREKANKAAFDTWEDEKDAMITGAWLDAAMLIGTQGLKGSKNETLASVGNAMASTGGQTALGALAGGLMGGKKGAITGAVAGFGSGIMTNEALPRMQEWNAQNEKKNIAKQAADDAKKKLEKEEFIKEVSGVIAGENKTVSSKMDAANKSRAKGEKSWFSKLFTHKKYTPSQETGSMYDQQEWYDFNYKKAGGFSKGGSVFGAELGTDTVPAMLTEGEFVVNADDAARNMGILKRINGGGRTKGYADGGYVTSDRASEGSFVGTDAGAGGLGLSDSVTELINEVRGVRTAIEEQQTAQESDRQGGPSNTINAQGSSTPSNVTNNINISVSMDDAGGSSSKTETSGRATEGGTGNDIEDMRARAEKDKELSEKIKFGVVDVILKEQRPGGLLFK